MTDFNRAEYYTPTEVASVLPVSTHRLNQWRKQGIGPAFVTQGGNANYYPKALIDDIAVKGLSDPRLKSWLAGS